MGVDVEYRDEKGQILEVLLDPLNAGGRLLSKAEGDRFPLLRWVDPYGDTFFNHLQMRGLIPELEDLAHIALTGDELTFLVAVRRLAEACSREVHTFLRFRGD